MTTVKHINHLHRYGITAHEDVTLRVPAADDFVRHHVTVTIAALSGIYQHDMQFDHCRLTDDLRYDTCADSHTVSLEYHGLGDASEILHLLMQHDRTQVLPYDHECFTIFDILVEVAVTRRGLI